MNTKLKTIFSVTLLLFALILNQCESTALAGLDLTNQQEDVTTPNTISPIGHSKIRGRRHLEEKKEDENVNTHTNKNLFHILVATISINIITLVVLLSLIPVLMNTRRNCFKSVFWVANAHVHAPTEIDNQYVNTGRSGIIKYVVKNSSEEAAILLADIFVPSFACGVILATILFLVIPEAILLIQRGTSSHEGEFEILPGTISRFGAAFMTGYMLPLALGALFPRSPELFYTEECVSNTDLRIKGVKKEVKHQVIAVDEEQQDKGFHQTKVTDEEQQDKGSTTIMGTKIKMIKMRVPMPAVFERLSRMETVAFLHQKFYPAPGQKRPASAKLSREEQVIDSNSEKMEDSTSESKITNTINDTSDLTTDAITNTNTNTVSEELLTDHNIDVNEFELTEGSTFESKITNTTSDTSTNGDYNAKTQVQEIYNINFRLAASILIGDIALNFIDGIFIGVIFMTCSTAAAVFVTIITIYKETSQETADYFLLTKFAGISIPRAVLLIFTSDLAVIVGALVITSAEPGELAIGIFLALGSGVYFHVSASECQPRVYSVVKVSRDRWLSLIFFMTGALPVGLTLLSHRHCNA